MLTSVKVRLKLELEKEFKFFYQHAGASRKVFNHFLGLQIENFNSGGKYISYINMQNMLPDLKRESEFTWLFKMESTSLQQVLKNLDQGYQNFFNSISGRRKGRKVNPPKFKSRNKNRPSFTIIYSSTKGSLYIKNKLWIPKLGYVKIWSGNERLKLIGGNKIQRITFSQDSDSNWYASILIEDLTSTSKYISTGNTCGIDVGIKDSLIVNSTKINIPSSLIKLDKKLRKYQRRMSKKNLKSNNRNRARRRVGRIHFRIKKIRENFQNQIVHKIVSSFDIVTMETLSISNMMKNRKLSRAIQNQSWYSFKIKLKTKCESNSKLFLEVNSSFPSSKLCSNCGELKTSLSLKDRHWTCKNCNVAHDRDINAARNLNLISAYCKSTGSIITSKVEFQKQIVPYLKLKLAA